VCSKLTVQSSVPHPPQYSCLYHSMYSSRVSKIFISNSYNTYLYAVKFISLSDDDDDDDDDDTGLLKNGHICVGTEL
jgi:hypothetical protein